MSRSDLPDEDSRSEEDDVEHPLKAGIDAAKEGDTASLDEILDGLE